MMRGPKVMTGEEVVVVDVDVAAEEVAEVAIEVTDAGEITTVIDVNAVTAVAET